MNYLADRFNVILERLNSKHRILWGDSMEEGLAEILEAMCARLEDLNHADMLLEERLERLEGLLK